MVESWTSKNIDCLMARTTCLVCFISSVNGSGNKKRKEKKKLTLGRVALVAGVANAKFSSLKLLIYEPVFALARLGVP